MPLCLAFAVFPDGPPLAHTGGFGEPTCLECHRGDPLNSPGGELRLIDVPDRYVPGHSYDIGILLRRSDLMRAGFEAALRHEGGTQAGGLAAGEGLEAKIRVRRDTTRGILYAHHIRAGTDVQGDSARWTVRWTAPDSGGDVLIHVASVAANDDNSPLGDYVYSVTARIRGPE